MLSFHINTLTCTLTSPQTLVTKRPYYITPPFCSLAIKLNNWDWENLASVQHMARCICIWLCAQRYNIQMWVVLNFCLNHPFYYFFFSFFLSFFPVEGAGLARCFLLSSDFFFFFLILLLQFLSSFPMEFRRDETQWDCLEIKFPPPPITLLESFNKECYCFCSFF